jgi:CubicO group peptidase (beta-lactamase class C family)
MMRPLPGAMLLLLAGALLGACAPPPPPPAPAPEPLRPAPPPPALVPAAPAEVGMNPALEARLDSIIDAARAEQVASAFAVGVGRHGRLVHLRGYGRTHVGIDSYPVEERTLFDLASLTKVVATTTAAMMLEEEGRLDLDRPVAYYLLELTDSAKAGITVRMLLTHTGGLEAGAPLHVRERCTPGGCTGPHRGRAQYLEAIDQRPLRQPPGTGTVYSDWDMILLQLVVERVSGQPLDVFLAQRVFGPLGMRDTHFSPVPTHNSRVTATSVDASRGLIHGEVHDGNAWAMGGVSGHAGLFSTVTDLAVFAQMLLNGGVYDGVRLLRQETIARWTAPQGPGSSRALGWDTPSGRSSAGRFFGARSFGHTGWTGTSLWIDPERSLFVILLTNRVNIPGENQRHVPLRRAIADAVQNSILDAPLVDWEAGRQ